MTIFTVLRYIIGDFLFNLRYKLFLKDKLRKFYFRALNRQTVMVKIGLGPPFINYYEFGVGWGSTLKKFITALKIFCNINKKDLYSYHIFGFDSYEGLPEKEGPKDDSKEWSKGSYSYSISEIEQKVLKRVINLKRNTIHFIKGFYEDSLTTELRNELSEYPPSIITIDCDYYSSTKIVLEWLRPMLYSGTLFYFDDMWSFHGHPNYGQPAAIREFNEIGEGQLIPFPLLGLNGQVFIYSRKEFEFTSKEKKL